MQSTTRSDDPAPTTATLYDLVEPVRAWQAAGAPVTVAVVVATRGFSSRQPAAAAAWTADGRLVGSLPPGVRIEDVTSGAGAAAHGALVEVVVGEQQALAAGLACGGTASLLVHPADRLPAQLWDLLAERQPLCVVSAADAADSARVLTPATVREAGGHGDEIPRLFGRGTSATAVTAAGEAVVALWPVPELVVVGDGLIAEALQAAGALLGWGVRVTPQVEAAVAAVGGLHRSDAVVVLSHDRAVDGPALAAALRGGAGYVGALGSRRTQAARAEWLRGHGVDDAELARIHGPAGLDIDAHTPGEIAVSIVAEILAARSQASGGALRDRSGPVHTAGVAAAPPRH